GPVRVHRGEVVPAIAPSSVEGFTRLGVFVAKFSLHEMLQLRSCRLTVICREPRSHVILVDAAKTTSLVLFPTPTRAGIITTDLIHPLSPARPQFPRLRFLASFT